MPEAYPHHLNMREVRMNHPDEILQLMDPWEVLVGRKVGPWENDALYRGEDLSGWELRVKCLKVPPPVLRMIKGAVEQGLVQHPLKLSVVDDEENIVDFGLYLLWSHQLGSVPSKHLFVYDIDVRVF